VLTGSSNWTTDSWTREENVILTLAVPALAQSFRDNFEELWTTRQVLGSGAASEWVSLAGAGGGRVRAYFCPNGASELLTELAARIETARRRIHLCSPVLTDTTVLNALTAASQSGGAELVIAYDATQMQEVRSQWLEDSQTNWKVSAFESLIASSARTGGKLSTPYSEGSTHDFMHAKIVVVDDCVFTGSYNLSHSGEMNAENVVQLEGPQVADLFSAYVNRVVDRYRAPAPAPTASTSEPV
jgi:phosphatidylserine/phosphatidylglycerophosphate/cardiolipin synthase-like enzyme